MPSVVEQPAQISEQMTTQSSSIEAAQPSATPQMSTDSVGLRGGEEAGCDCCCCGCEESCC